MKTLFSIDRIKVCLFQPEGFFDKLHQLYHLVPGRERKVINYDGYYLSFEKSEDVNDKDITAGLFLGGAVKLGCFTFNKSDKYRDKKSDKYRDKCFFVFETKSLYEVSGYTFDKDGGRVKVNYFSYPFNVFDDLGLQFNNVTSIEIACDTEARVYGGIQYAVSHPDVFEMVLLGRKVKDPNAMLEGYGEYYQRTRLTRLPRPTIYIRPAHPERGNNRELKVYDKARELLQSRPDKKDLQDAWLGMGDKVQRMEISVQNKQFRQFYSKMRRQYPDRWDGLEHFFYDLGQDEEIRFLMFDYFAESLLHFRVRNHDKTHVSLCDLTINNTATLRRLAQKKCKPRGRSAK